MSPSAPRARIGLKRSNGNSKMPPSLPLGRKFSMFASSGFVMLGKPRGLWQWAQLPSMYACAFSSPSAVMSSPSALAVLRGLRAPCDSSSGLTSSGDVMPVMTPTSISRCSWVSSSAPVASYVPPVPVARRLTCSGMKPSTKSLVGLPMWH